ncbi:Imm15 family immunity protein [Actinomadura madurae]|uniref:Imm15 family immunity protein n=1 Tax=Actinomadura madurae TaxID=1993 RepID=UPI0020D219C4|nr:Imm15 family immunity protein [Actinomadura madurae]MCP9948689.1 hypothetical protein [Actinomadura madurae]MCP9965461.1 hypothetical protein [Actinomadura madurae]MCP9977950.1 hypothetical protein [Actinomadura madurae]MCQ0010551.1 hypothetical protein [Actinomadura madurae]
MKNDPEYEADFQRLIIEQRIDRHEFFRDLQDDFGFDEPPLYAQYHQLSFLDGLPTAEKNAVLIRAAVRHLRTLIDHSTALYCMLSIQGWDEWQNNGLLDPRFFIAAPDHHPDPAGPRGILDYLHFNPPTSPYSAFVADALDNDPSLITQEAPQHDHRVYVRPTPLVHHLPDLPLNPAKRPHAFSSAPRTA